MSEETTVGDVTVKKEPSILKRATMAVVVSAGLVIGGLIYLAYTQNTDGILVLVGAGATFLFKETKTNNK